MRVIAGDLGGRRLHAPGAGGFRPTTDRVREALFNILAGRVHWEGAAVCDLYAGSGSLAIEALSRGAARATCVERAREAVALLRKNIAALALDGRCRVVAAPVERFLRSDAGCYRVIFADPPYGQTDGTELLGMIAAGSRLERDGLFCLEHAAAAAPSAAPSDPAPPWELADRRVYGDTAVSFYRCTSDNHARSSA